MTGEGVLHSMHVVASVKIARRFKALKRAAFGFRVLQSRRCETKVFDMRFLIQDPGCRFRAFTFNNQGVIHLSISFPA